MPGQSSKAKAAVRAPGDPHLPKPAPPPRTTHMPTKEVVDEYVKVVGVENVAGIGIRMLECALSVNEIKGLPGIPIRDKDVCSVTERLQKLQQDNGAPTALMEDPRALMCTHDPKGGSKCRDVYPRLQGIQRP